MTRRQNLLAAALVTSALVLAWAFADSGRAPFSRKGMNPPVAEEQAAHLSPAEELAAAKQNLATKEDFMRSRTKAARAVKDRVSTLRFMLEMVRGSEEETVDVLMAAMRMRSLKASQPEHEAQLQALLDAHSKLCLEYAEALRAAYAHVMEAECYGNEDVRSFFAVIPELIESAELEASAGRIIRIEPDETGATPARIVPEEGETPEAPAAPPAEAHEEGVELPAEPEMEGPEPQCRFAEAAIKLNWTLDVLRQRAECAESVQDAASARRYLACVAAGAKADNLLRVAQAALNPQEEHSCAFTKDLRARCQEIEDVLTWLKKAEADMLARAAAAEGYGVEELLP